MCISYIGGKSKISTWLVPFYPKDMETYVETFSGMFWCFFKMDLEEYPNLKTIVYNDFNPLNANLFKCVRNHKELLKECNKLVVQEKDVFPTNPICKQNFDTFQKELFSGDLVIGEEPNYEVAAKYAYVLTQVFSGSKPETSKFIDLKGKYHSKFTSFKNKLGNDKFHKLFESITNVENMDFGDVIDKYDSSTTYFYADPPYWKTENYYSNHDFDVNDHLRLADKLKSIKGKFSLSYYDFPLLSEWFPKDEYVWEKKLFAKAAAAKKGVSQNMGEELLIMNYEL
jgi:DNA adenine methylase